MSEIPAEGGVQANFFDCILECLDSLNTSEHDDNVCKQDVIDNLRSMLSIMVSRLLTGNTWGQAMFVTGWELEDAVPN